MMLSPRTTLAHPLAAAPQRDAARPTARLDRLLQGGSPILGIAAAALLLGSAALHTSDNAAASVPSTPVTGAGPLVSKLRWLSPTAADETGDAADDSSDDDAALPALGLRLQAAADYVARRYHVAGAAIAPILRTVDSSARDAGIDPLLVVAVIGVESGFNPLSESAMGARGLMQVIGRYHTEKLGDDGDPNALLDPHTNVRVGVRVLQECLHRNKRLEIALQAYGGASDDGEQSYAHRVMAERLRIEDYVRRATATRTADASRNRQT